MKIAIKIGAAVVDMDEVQLHPTGFVDLNDRYDNHKILAPELIRGVGAILINQNGKRFCNELGSRDYVSQRIIKNCNLAYTDKIKQYEAFIILNQDALDEYGGNILFYVKKGLLRKYNSIEEFSKIFNLNSTQVKITFEKYNIDCDKKIDEFGKRVFPRKINPNDYFYAGIVTPSIHYTMGGIKMNKDGEIINIHGNVIKGLYGAGEVTGGVHGGNRLGGNSLLECAVYGRRTARAAYQFIKNLV
jgi:succinate dehydrogenase/fumarate reductase flavoprotein subunit